MVINKNCELTKYKNSHASQPAPLHAATKRNTAAGITSRTNVKVGQGWLQGKKIS
jgi:hypothetical protein